MWAKQGSASKKLGTLGPKASDGKLPLSVYTIARGESSTAKAQLINWCQARCDEWAPCEFFEVQRANMRCALQWRTTHFGPGDVWSQAKATMPIDWITEDHPPASGTVEKGHWELYVAAKATP